MTGEADRDVSPERAVSSPTPILIFADGASSDIHKRAGDLATTLGLPICDEPPTGGGDALLLVVCAHRIELRETGKGAAGPLCVDFVHGAMRHRRHSTLQTRSLLARAIGKPVAGTSVFDATAGLGRDAFVLASLGYSVAAVERDPVIAVIVRDGLARAESTGNTDIRAAVHRLSYSFGDARDVLAGLDQAGRPDVVYLDPMYAGESGTALVKKEMRFCRRVVGDDTDARELLDIAVRVARRRVVVKRHRRAEPLGQSPAHRHMGRAVRYDVYRPLGS